MEIENTINGNEFDFCLNCGNDGDNTNLYKIKNSKNFICSSCKYEYEQAQSLINEFKKLNEVKK